MKEIHVQENDAGQRVDRFLMKLFPSLPKGMMYKAIRNKKIKVNRKRCTIDQRLQFQDVVHLFLPPEVLEEKKQADAFLQVPKELDICYEDEQILIVDKPVGLRSQSDAAGPQDCVVMRVLRYLYEQGSYEPHREQSFTPAICNRLDRNTRGLIIAAKTANALREINAGIRSHQVKKYYLACIEGKMDREQEEIQLYHQKIGTKAQLYAHPHPGAYPCALRYRQLAFYHDASLLEVELISGKFHQIRAMFAFMHHPLLGDVKYGAKQRNTYQALAAVRLQFAFPQESTMAYLNNQTIAIPWEKIEKDWKQQGIL